MELNELLALADTPENLARAIELGQELNALKARHDEICAELEILGFTQKPVIVTVAETPEEQAPPPPARIGPAAQPVVQDTRPTVIKVPAEYKDLHRTLAAKGLEMLFLSDGNVNFLGKTFPIDQARNKAHEAIARVEHAKQNPQKEQVA